MRGPGNSHNWSLSRRPGFFCLVMPAMITAEARASLPPDPNH